MFEDQNMLRSRLWHINLSYIQNDEDFYRFIP
jgi:hypothetical protein